jgi:hypothetical protein
MLCMVQVEEVQHFACVSTYKSCIPRSSAPSEDVSDVNSLLQGRFGRSTYETDSDSQGVAAHWTFRCEALLLKGACHSHWHAALFMQHARSTGAFCHAVCIVALPDVILLY